MHIFIVTTGEISFISFHQTKKLHFDCSGSKGVTISEQLKLLPLFSEHPKPEILTSEILRKFGASYFIFSFQTGVFSCEP